MSMTLVRTEVLHFVYSVLHEPVQALYMLYNDTITIKTTEDVWMGVSFDPALFDFHPTPYSENFNGR
jgi:hypothetical protein